MDILPRKRGRPRKENSFVNDKSLTKVSDVGNSSSINQCSGVVPTLVNVKERGRPRKEPVVESPMNRQRCK